MGKIKKCVLIMGLVLLVFRLTAQEKFTVSGSIKDAETGEQLIGANVFINENTNIGTIANEYGFFSLTLQQGKYNVIIRYLGYNSDTLRINLIKSIKVDVSLRVTSNEIQEVVLSSRRKDENIRSAQTGLTKLDPKDISKIPVLFGEKDVLKTLQLLPGVKSAGEGNSGFNVRGGAGDQNLILLDEAPVYNASHLLGFFSTFNSDAIKDVTLYKGTQPAQYGGRLSSVLDIKMNEGNNQKFAVGGGIGLISSKLYVEGPIKKDNGSFLITGRRTYVDMFLKLSPDKNMRKNKLYFYDLNAKLNYKFSDKDRLYLSGYFGRDVLGMGETMGIDWGNYTTTLRWNHVVSDKIFSNTSVLLSNYDYAININSGSNDIKISSQIKDYNLKQEFQFFPNPNNSIRIGFNSIYHNIIPGKTESSGSSSILNSEDQHRHSWENSLYLNDDIKINNRLSINAGVRVTAFSILGKGDFYTLDNNLAVIDTISYKKGEFVKTYFNIEPRLSFNYMIGKRSSMKASYTRNVQNLHLISNSTTTNPTDKWIPTSNTIKPEVADQFSVGYFRNLVDNKFEFSMEGYYKHMQNQIDYKNGANVESADAIETQLLYGNGRAYGVEFLIKKVTGKFTGWIGYTLSRTEKRIDGINSSNWYPAKQDRTHDISIVLMYDVTPKFNLSASWVYYTGNAVTFPSGKYNVDDQVVFYYTERNGYRMPNYHRLDLGATWKVKERKDYSSELSFGLYNAYGRENAYSISFRQSETDPTRTEAVQTSLFKFIPSITWNFKFK